MSGPVSAPTPSPERPGGDRLEVPRHAACGSIIAHGPHLGCDGLTYPSYDGGWLTDAEADRDLPAPDPRSPEDGAGAPTPFETFQAGMFAGIMAERVAGRDPQDWTEGEVRREFRDWLEERAAATPANGATR